MLVPAIEETFPIDWEKAVTDRQAKMKACQSHASGIQPDQQAQTIH